MEPIPKRFASVSENEVAEVLQDRVPKATKSSTSTWVAVFTEYLKANDASCELNFQLERNFNVYSDPEFRKSNNVLDGVLKKLRREGKMEPIHHKQPITKNFQGANVVFNITK